MTNAFVTRRQRLNDAVQALSAFYFQNRYHEKAPAVAAKIDDVLGMIEGWWEAQREWTRERA